MYHLLPVYFGVDVSNALVLHQDIVEHTAIFIEYARIVDIKQIIQSSCPNNIK